MCSKRILHFGGRPSVPDAMVMVQQDDFYARFPLLPIPGVNVRSKTSYLQTIAAADVLKGEEKSLESEDVT